MPALRNCTYRFGDFVLDPQTGELLRSGVRFRLSTQPAEVLRILVENAGQLVPRDVFREKLWHESSFGDFDHGLNNAILRIREALGDSAAAPRFIETLPRRGYRFIAQVEAVVTEADAASPPEAQALPSIRRRFPRMPVWGSAGLGLILVISTSAFWLASRASNAEPRPHRLVVLPFRNLNKTSAEDYLADGMTEEVTTGLGKLKSTQVVSGNTALRFTQPGKPTPQIVEELKVDRIVQGSVQQFGGRVRVTVQLIDARDDHQIWAEAYDRDLRSAFELQDEVVFAVAHHLDVRKEELQDLAMSRKIDPEAQLYFAKAFYSCQHYTKATYNVCLNLLQQAIDKDPGYAEAYARLAVTYDQLELHGMLPASETMPRAKAAAAKALALDPSLAAAHVAQAIVLSDYEWNANAAEKEFLRAGELQPSFPSAHHARGWLLIALGRWDEAIREFTICLELYPMAPEYNIDMGYALTRAGRWGEAEKFLKAAIEFAPDSSGIHYLVGYAYWIQHRYEESMREFAAAAKGGPSGRLGLVYAAAGHKADAFAMLKRIEQEPVTEGETAYDHAVMYTAIGDKQRALELLNKAYVLHCQCMLDLQQDAMLQSLRSEPRFQELVVRVGFSAAS